MTKKNAVVPAEAGTLSRRPWGAPHPRLRGDGEERAQ
jgi:hypothetical protein